jgi:hypothetical protein
METAATITIAPPKRQRRWLQFSVRTLLVLILVASVGLAWIASKLKQSREQRQAVQAIQRLGGTAIYKGGETEPKAPLGFDWLTSLLGDDFFSDCVTVEFQNATDAGLVHLQKLHQLREVYLGGALITDDGLAHVESLLQLQELSLENTQITSAGLARLKGLSQLKTLNVAGTSITDGGLLELTALKQLRDLDLRRTRVTESGAKEFRKALPTAVIHRSFD